MRMQTTLRGLRRNEETHEDLKTEGDLLGKVSRSEKGMSKAHRV